MVILPPYFRTFDSEQYGSDAMMRFSTQPRFAIIFAAFLVVLGTIIAPHHSQAQGLPVYDNANFIVNTANLGESQDQSLAIGFSAAKLQSIELTSAATAVSTAGLTSSYTAKEYGLDSIGWLVAKMAIQSLTGSIVNWINSGFNGSPAFVTDLEGTLLQVGDAAANNFLNQVIATGLNSPFISSVVQTAGTLYYLSSNPNALLNAAQYTLNQYTPNPGAFLAGSFSQGGWDAWMSTITNLQNNPFGSGLAIQNSLNNAVAKATSQQLTELGWGNGFLSFRGDCSSSGQTQAPTSVQLPTLDLQQNADGTYSDSGKGGTETVTLGGSSGACLGQSIKTPGAVIQSQLEKTLGSSVDQLVSADEFNEIIGALMSQLLQQTLGPNGLGGLIAGFNGGSSYIDQASNPSQYTNTSAGQNIAQTLLQGIAGQTQQVQQYQTDWGRIESEADLASTTAALCGSTTEQTVNGIILQANQANLKAAQALVALLQVQSDATAALQAIQQSLTTPSTNATSTPNIVDLGDEYQQLLASPTMPSASDIAYAQQQSQDSTGTIPWDPNSTSAPPPETGQTTTLFTQMKNLVTNGTCLTP